MLRKGGAGKKALWLDEVGWGSDKDGFSLNQFRHFTNLQGRPVPHHHHPHHRHGSWGADSSPRQPAG